MITEYNFSDNEINMLCKYRDIQNNTRLKIRFIALIILALTKDITSAATAVGRSVRCVNNWLNQYISQGINSLNSFNYKPKQSFLNFFQINQIIIYV